MDNPTALQSENLPPTQSHIGKMFSGSIPNSSTWEILLETATKCLETASASACFLNQVLAVLALLKVSWVVKVFETITNSVVSGFRSFKVSCTWSPSTLEI